MKGAQPDETAQPARSERLKLKQGHTCSLSLEERTVDLRSLESALPQGTRLVAKRGCLRGRLTMDQLGSTVRGCRTTMSCEPAF